MLAERNERIFLREGDLAARWRISVKTLQRWRYIGVGPDHLKLEGTVVYLLETIEKYEDTHFKRRGI